MEAIRDLSAAIREHGSGRGSHGPAPVTRVHADQVDWSGTDTAYARRALRPISDKTPEEQLILDRMRSRKTPNAKSARKNTLTKDTNITTDKDDKAR